MYEYRRLLRDLVAGAGLMIALVCVNLAFVAILGCDGKSSYHYTNIFAPVDTLEAPIDRDCKQDLSDCMAAEAKRHQLAKRACKQLKHSARKKCDKLESTRHKAAKLACQKAFRECVDDQAR